jgi:hypothetical protein
MPLRFGLVFHLLKRSVQENDGYPGYIISQVQGIAENAIAANFKPNLVLLNAGTNDCLQSVDTGNAANRLLSLIQVRWFP